MCIRDSKIVLADRRMKVSEISETAGTLAECVHSILHKHLCTTTLWARWSHICWHLMNKQCRKHVSTYYLALYTCNPTKFMCRFITLDKTRVHHNAPETNQRSNQQTIKMNQIQGKCNGRNARRSMTPNPYLLLTKEKEKNKKRNSELPTNGCTDSAW